MRKRWRRTGRRAAAAVLAVLAARGAAGADAPDRTVVVRGRSIHVLGSARARVVMVEFGDYECPFCHRYHEDTFPRLKADYIDTGKVRYVVRDLPIPVHAHAQEAAEAARCAGAQGRFWPMRAALIDHWRDLGPESLAALAQAAGLSGAAFDACRTAHAFAAAVAADVADGRAAGLDRTPSFVIGRPVAGGISGVVVVGARPYASFRERLDKALQKP